MLPSGATGDTGGPTASPGASLSGVTDVANADFAAAISGGDDGDLLGGYVSLATGDFNNDGVADIVVGAPMADGPDDARTDAGEAYLFYGPLEGEREVSEADLLIIGRSAGDNVGHSTATGDLNGDGVDDLVVGAPGVTAGWDPRSDQGRAYVFFGGEDLDGTRDLADDAYDFVVTGAEGFSRLGHSIAIDDTNGDGTADLVVGAPFAGREPGTAPGGPRTGVGEVYVIFGRGDLSGEVSIPSLQQDATFSGNEEFAQFGISLAVDDVNGDGDADVVVGASRVTTMDGSRPAGGAVYVFFGGTGLKGTQSVANSDQGVTILGASAGSTLGFPLTSGDFDGDGVADIAVGAQLEGAEDLQTVGVLRVLHGSEDLDGVVDLRTSEAPVHIAGSFTSEIFPSALSAGDLTADGVDDLLVGSVLAGTDANRPGAGMVYVLDGGPDFAADVDSVSDSGLAAFSGAAADDRLGAAIAVAEGPSPLLIMLAPNAAKGDSQDAGEVYVISKEQVGG